MTFHVALKSGKWIGGFSVTRDGLAAHLDDMREHATSWGEPLIATRRDNRGGKRGETYTILPKETN